MDKRQMEKDLHLEIFDKCGKREMLCSLLGNMGILDEDQFGRIQNLVFGNGWFGRTELTKEAVAQLLLQLAWLKRLADNQQEELAGLSKEAVEQLKESVDILNDRCNMQAAEIEQLNGCCKRLNALCKNLMEDYKKVRQLACVAYANLLAITSLSEESKMEIKELGDLTKHHFDYDKDYAALTNGDE